MHETTWKPWIKTLAIDTTVLHNNNHNAVIEEQSLNFSKNQPKLTVGFELTFHKGALQL